MPDEARSPELRDYLAVLWLRKWWIVAAVLVVVGAALAFSFTQTATYASSAEVLVLPVQVPGPGGASTGFVNIDQELRIATSPAVASRAYDVLAAKGLSPGSVSVSIPSSTDSLSFLANSEDPRAAQATAQAYADSYLRFREDSLFSNVEAATASIDQVIAGLNGQLQRAQSRAVHADNFAQQAALEQRISALTSQISAQQSLRSDLVLAQNTNVGEVLAHATRPISPASPNPRKSGAIGLFVGLCLGIGLAFFRDRLDQHLRGRDEIEGLIEAPIIGMIPRASSLETRLAVAPNGDPHAGEAFRSLRTRVLFGISKEPIRNIMVTSAEAGEGKTTTAANLAVALAQADSRCVLVSADLRKPALKRYFPSMSGLGVSDILSGTAQLADALTPSPIPNLYLLPSGSDLRHPENGLASERMSKILEALSQHADLVVLDSAPILGVSDSLELASIVESVLLVVDASRSRRGSVEEAADELLSVGAVIMGAVLTRFDPSKFRPYGYGHARYYGYERETEPKRGQRAARAANTDDGFTRDLSERTWQA
jgi:capsular exopolysaccharide synthesis family protein